MKLLALASVVLSVSMLAPVAFCAEPVTSFDVAVTVDDLPAHGSLPKGTSRTEIATSLLATLKAHKVPEAWGFVNAVRVKEEPDSEETLKLWRQAGYPLGNHTYSHVNLRTVGLKAFLADLEAGEPLVKHYMAGQDWRVLRFPFLSAGTGADHEGIMAWLKAHGYRIADVSLGFSDWAYTEPYNRCMAKGDTAAIDAMKAQYFKSIDVEITRTKILSQRLYGRQIPLVLLTHEGGFSAVTLSQVLQMMEKQGAHYVTLEKAESDPAYQETGPTAADGDLMGRMAQTKGGNVWADLPPSVPINNLDGVCR